MAKVTGYTEFSDEEIRDQEQKARQAETEEQRKKAKRFKLEMMAYNLRAARGDFD